MALGCCKSSCFSMAAEHTSLIIKNEVGGFGVRSVAVRSCLLKKNVFDE